MLSRLLLTISLILVTSSLAGSPVEKLLDRPEAWYRSDAGVRALENILSWQSDRGDWPKNRDVSLEPHEGDRAKLAGTFDNGATTGELRVLARAFRVTGTVRYREAFLRGLDHVLRAQYPNGGWPQRFPPGRGYARHITFNDHSMVRLLEFLEDVAGDEEFAFLDSGRRKAASWAVTRGIECILRCQVRVKEKLTVWCAQHDLETLRPTGARSYEHPSLSGSESAGILLFLMKIEKPTPEIVRAVKAGVAWFESSRITGFRFRRSASGPALLPDPEARSLWARFYEIESGRPIFSDRDGIVKYDLQEIGEERRTGYSWYGHWGEKVAREYERWPHGEE